MASRAQIYTLDAIIGATMILATIATLAAAKSLLTVTTYMPPDDVLSVLLSDVEFVNMILANDTAGVKAYLDAVLAWPYNLSVFTVDGRLLWSVGRRVRGVAAVGMIVSWNGTLLERPLLVCLIVERGGAT